MSTSTATTSGNQIEPETPRATDVLARVRVIATEFGEQRRERQRRRELDPTDFNRLAQAGFLRWGVPVDQGGLWESVASSTRPVCDLLRALGRGDPSVALVCAMHPTVLAFWLATPDASEPFGAAWQEQRRQIFRTVLDGAWWGTATSEPGSGGDIGRTRATATGSDDEIFDRLTGEKQFASGSGIASYMMTVAVPEGAETPELFFLDVRDAPWDGSTGMLMRAPWDGLGMTATQSHAFRFERFPASRVAWPGNLTALGAAAQPYIRCCFTAVFVGIVDAAVATARDQLSKRGTSLRAYEQVEWARAEMEGWLVEQAYEGMLRALEENRDAAHASVQGKIAVAELAEAALTRLCRVLGGGTFARSSPFGVWAQDVRALGFLRPPWGLAFDNLSAGLSATHSG